MMSDDPTGQLQYWYDKWQSGDVTFYEHELLPNMVKHYDNVVNGSNGLKIFVPLCGKSIYMKWLCEKGHTVVGVEVYEKSVKDFFEESRIEYTTTTVDELDGGKLYKSVDGCIRIYVCDLFDFGASGVEVDFQAVWDHNSLVALSKDQWPRYGKTMRAVMGAECRYLLHVYQFDDSHFHLDPHSVHLEDIHAIFNIDSTHSYTLNQLDSSTVPTTQPDMHAVGLHTMDEP